jgi:hypothetical protein
MDEHGIDWLLGCNLVGFGLESWANCGWFLSSHNYKIDPAGLTWTGWPPQHKTQFIIIIWTCQAMMVLTSMELIGSLDVIW